MAKLIHYAASPIKKLEKRDYIKGNPKQWYTWEKPHGLWVSAKGEDDWEEWCKSEGYNLDGLKHAHEVVLKKETNILLLDDVKKILDLQSQYPIKIENTISFCLSNISVDWKAIMEKYDGIIIAPYQWECRLDSNCKWYYGWDCASGCIWNLDILESFKLMDKDESD